MPTPTDTSLYQRVKSAARKKFKVYPSAYANAWLVKEYKRRGGKYRGSKPGRTRKKSGRSKRRSKSKSSGLTRWFDEEWIDVCKLPKIVKCGRSKLRSKDWKKKYPYCRPRKRVNSSTPRTASEIPKSELKRRCKLKRKSPLKRVLRK